MAGACFVGVASSDVRAIGPGVLSPAILMSIPLPFSFDNQL